MSQSIFPSMGSLWRVKDALVGEGKLLLVVGRDPPWLEVMGDEGVQRLHFTALTSRCEPVSGAQSSPVASLDRGSRGEGWSEDEGEGDT